MILKFARLASDKYNSNMTKILEKLGINKDNCVLGIGLFEEQIVRSLFISDEFRLLKQLTNQNEVIIFTNQAIGDFLDTKIKELSMNKVQVLKFKEIKQSLLTKVFSFCLKWSDPSTATMRSLHREKISKRINVFGYWFRRAFFVCFRNVVLFKSIFRKLLLFTYKIDDIKNYSLTIIPNIDVFLATALSNSESDLPLSIYFKKKSIPVIAGLRSWDNLVTKGILKLQPNFLLSHSEYMTDLAIRVHGISPTSVIQSVTPSYQIRFQPDRELKENKLLNITYGCIGPALNPDEINFISWLGDISNDIDVTITVVQHPKFKHNLEVIDTGKLHFKTFDYLSTTLQEYFQFIADQDLVIASGTSFALDTMFAKTPLVGLAFEIIQQDYWFSHLRSYDALPHSKHLFDKLLIKKITSEAQLIEILKGKRNLQDFVNSTDSLQYLTGNIDLRFDDQILDLFK
jgi:hypothetical protein